MFNTTVDQLVKTALANQPVHTQMFNGTLFVSAITEQQARSVFHRLSETFGVGTVQVSAIGDTGEYAFDFVAAPVEELSPFATVNS